MQVGDDLGVFYSGWPAVSVSHLPKSGQSGSGRAILDCPGESLLGGAVLGTDFSLRYPVATFPNVRRGDQFEIGGALYVVSEAPQAVSDGLENVVQLRVAA